MNFKDTYRPKGSCGNEKNTLLNSIINKSASPLYLLVNTLSFLLKNPWNNGKGNHMDSRQESHSIKHLQCSSGGLHHVIKIVGNWPVSNATSAIYFPNKPHYPAVLSKETSSVLIHCSQSIYQLFFLKALN